jgi:hypothetical protein
LILFLSSIDLVLIEYNIRNKVDVFMPGLLFMAILIFDIYTIVIQLIIKRKNMLENNLMLSFLFLSPCVIFLFVHLIIGLSYVFVWLR